MSGIPTDGFWRRSEFYNSIDSINDAHGYFGFAEYAVARDWRPVRDDHGGLLHFVELSPVLE